ncbi:MAG: hypothetical protein ABSD47_18315 [Candidatus Methylomirabilota bacterium]|jgi:hypothetical protein
MRRLDARNILAILFVVAGAIPIVVWLASWVYHNMKPEHLVQAVVILIALYLAWWFRKRLERK